MKTATVTLAGLIAASLKLEDRAGVEVVKTVRNGSGTRVTVSGTWEALDAMIDQLSQDHAATTTSGKPMFTSDVRRSIQRSIDELVTAQQEIEGAETYTPDDGEPAPDIRTLPAETPVDSEQDGDTWAARTARQLIRASNGDVDPAVEARATEAAIERARRGWSLTDYESQLVAKSGVVIDNQIAVKHSLVVAVEVDETLEAIERRPISHPITESSSTADVAVSQLRTTKAAMDESQRKVDAAEAMSPAPRNLAALRAVLSRRKTLYQLAVRQAEALAQTIGQPA
jgi:hypothetical protein